jgi:hypothetical protein
MIAVRVLGLSGAVGALVVAGLTIAVPHGPAPRLDGRAEGWDQAAVVLLPDASELRLLHDGSSLFIGLLTASERIGSICIASGSQVRVLHASMALGDVTYTARADGWRRGPDFAWGMRETDLLDATQRRRAAWYAEHGWVATTAPMSRPLHLLQFRVAVDAHRVDDLRLAVAHLAMTGAGAVVRWPDGGDDCGRAELVQGAAPETAQFRPQEWSGLRLLSPAAARAP